MYEKSKLDGDERGIHELGGANGSCHLVDGLRAWVLIALFAVVLLASAGLIGWMMDDLCQKVSDQLGRPIGGAVQSGAVAPSPDSLVDSSVDEYRGEASVGLHVKPEWLIGTALLLVISITCTCLIIVIPLRFGKRVPIGSVVAGIALCCMLWSGLSNLLDAVDLSSDPDSASTSTEERFQ